ncbi:MAG: hypothetical protein ABIK09_06665 [Pseudomonadota bacterium]
MYGRTLLAAVLALLLLGCSGEDETTAVHSGAPVQPRLRQPALPLDLGGARDLQITSWPDLGKPGGEVVLQVRPIPEDADLTDLLFRLVADPCGGALDQDGTKAVYHIPKSCRGGRITVEAAVPRGDEETLRSFSFRVEGEGDEMGSLMLWPEEKATVVSPIQVAWDRTFVRKEELGIDLRVVRRGETVVALRGLGAEEEVELDVPASPEPTWLEMCAGADNCQKVRLSVFARRAIVPHRMALVVDDFSLPEANRIGGRRGTVSASTRVKLRQGEIRGSGAEEPTRYLAVEYHRSPDGSPQGLEETLAPAGESCSLRAHPFLSIWLRPGPLNEMPGPVMVRLTSRDGETWTRRVNHRGASWEEHRVDIGRFVQRFGSATKLELYIDEERARIPAGTFHVGPIAFLSRPTATAPPDVGPEAPPEPPPDDGPAPATPAAEEDDGSWSEGR